MAEVRNVEVPVTISLVAQLEPLAKPTGEAFTGDLQAYAESFCAYVAENLERFADLRGGDTFVAVLLTRGGEKADHSFRSGHFVRDDLDSQPVKAAIDRRAALADLEQALTLALQAMAGNDRCADPEDPDWRGPAVERFRTDLQALGVTEAELEEAGIRA